MNLRLSIPTLTLTLALALAVILASCQSQPERYIVVTAPPEPAATKAAPVASHTPAPEPPAAPQPAPQLDVAPETPFNAVGAAPPRGTPTEYDQMVEALRTVMVGYHGPLDMTATSIHRLGDWAWLEGQPHESGTRSLHVDPVGALMRRVDGSWRVVAIPCTEPTDECQEGWKRLPKEHRAAPAAILPTTPAGATKAAAVLTAQLGATHFTLPLEELARKLKLAPGEVFKIEEVGRDEHSSQHIVALLDREPLHRHDTHDLLVVVLEGEGEMLIGSDTRAIGAHSIVYVPRHTVHSMHNTQQKPLIGYAIFTPPFDGKDRVPVDKP